jgi:hypothetical protein
MTALLPNPRYERKFVVHGVSAAEVRAAIRRHPALFRQAFPPRSINNVYFDTPRLADYQDHARGATARAKTRVRWYGDTRGSACPALERKLRYGQLGGKESYRLPPICFEGLDALRSLAAMIAGADLPEVVRESLASRAPVLLNRYDREYLVSADRRFRVTVDSRLRFAGACGLDGATLGSVPAVPGVIVELKFAPSHAEDAAMVGQALPFRLGRFSKYMFGLSLVRGAAPACR